MRSSWVVCCQDVGGLALGGQALFSSFCVGSGIPAMEGRFAKESACSGSHITVNKFSYN